jgi:peptide-methionine (R)-S-oxide reductase
MTNTPLSPAAYHVLCECGTEAPGSSPLYHESRPGTYACARCNQPLFASKDKFASGTGWPSYTAPIAPNAITTHNDTSHGMTRVEVRCAGCNGHLGHVFPDGPPPTGQRYCINGVAMSFTPTL